MKVDLVTEQPSTWRVLLVQGDVQGVVGVAKDHDGIRIRAVDISFPRVVDIYRLDWLSKQQLQQILDSDWASHNVRRAAAAMLERSERK